MEDSSTASNQSKTMTAATLTRRGASTAAAAAAARSVRSSCGCAIPAVRPRLARPAAAHSTRSFSLWPAAASSSSSTSTSTSTSDGAIAGALEPGATTEHLSSSSAADLPLDALSPILTTPVAPTLFAPLSSAFLELSATLLPSSSSASMALAVPVFTLVLRALTGTPTLLWQRRRTRFFSQHVLPKIRQAQEELRYTIRAECRKRGASYEEYMAEYKKQAIAVGKRISKEERCRPLVTVLIPPLVNVPIFILATLTIRDVCQRALTSLTAPDTLANSSPALLDALHEFATTPAMWCASLALPDQSMLLALWVGLAAVSNVELSTLLRRRTSARLSKEATESNERLAGAKRDQALEARKALRSEAAQAWLMRNDPQAQPKRGYATKRTPPAPLPTSSRGGTNVRARPVSQAQPAATAENDGAVIEQEDPLTARIVTNALRISGIVFIPIAAQAPAAVCLYWITSNLYTLAQNAFLYWLDRPISPPSSSSPAPRAASSASASPSQGQTIRIRQ